MKVNTGTIQSVKKIQSFYARGPGGAWESTTYSSVYLFGVITTIFSTT